MYTAKVTELQEKGWGHVQIGIYQDETLLHEFIHNYKNLTYLETLIKFLKYQDKHYVICAESYHNLVMRSLPDCKEVGRLELQNVCPLDIYIPEYAIEPNQEKYPGLFYLDNDDGEENLDFNNTPFGFVLAVYWGAESSGLIYKLTIDLSQENCLKLDRDHSKGLGSSVEIHVTNKIPRLRDFLYIEGMDSLDFNHWRVVMHLPVWFEVLSGKKLNF